MTACFLAVQVCEVLPEGTLLVAEEVSGRGGDLNTLVKTGNRHREIFADKLQLEGRYLLGKQTLPLQTNQKRDRLSCAGRRMIKVYERAVNPSYTKKEKGNLCHVWVSN